MKILLALIMSITCFANDYTLRKMADEKGINLSEQEKETLTKGVMSDGRYYTGAILGTYPLGFGIGHAIQGRYSTDGWKFTLGEFVSLALMVSGATKCIGESFSGNDDCDNTLMTLGAFGFLGFRIWEIVDLWSAPVGQERKYKELQNYIETHKEKKVSFSLAPVLSTNKKLGFGLNINF